MNEIVITIRFDIMKRRMTLEWPEIDDTVLIGLLERAKMAYFLAKSKDGTAPAGRTVVADGLTLPPVH